MMAMATTMVSAVAPTAVVRARHSQVLGALRRRHSGVPVCWAGCVGMTSGSSAPEGCPVGITTMTLVRVRRCGIDNRLLRVRGSRESVLVRHSEMVRLVRVGGSMVVVQGKAELALVGDR